MSDKLQLVARESELPAVARGWSLVIESQRQRSMATTEGF